MKKFLAYSLLSLLMCNCVSTQICDSDLEIEIKKTIEQACIYKVKALNAHFAKIADIKESDEVKDYHIEACLDLFMGRGNDIKDDDGNIISPAPRVEVPSLGIGQINSYCIKDYLERLKVMGYSKVVVKNVSCYTIGGGEVKKVSKNQYLANVLFQQVSIGYNGDLIVSRDNTKNSIKVLIEKDKSGSFEVLLGDIKVEQTEIY